MTEATSPTPNASAPQTAGQWLREARTRQGMHLAMLSVALKVPVRTLEMLEADRHDELPGPTFVRALASSMCRHLRLDPAEVLALLPQREARMAPLPASLEAAVPAQRARRRWTVDRSHAGYAVLGLGMLAVIAGLLWWPSMAQRTSLPEKPVSFMPPAEPGVAASTPSESGTTIVIPVAVPEVPAPAQPQAASVAPAPAVPKASEPGPAVATPAVIPAMTPVITPAAAPASTASASAGAPALRLSASGESWVEVRTRDDQVVFSQVVQAGQVHEIRQAGPLKVVLGRAAVMQVQVRGQPFDLAPHTKITVARFEVNP